MNIWLSESNRAELQSMAPNFSLEELECKCGKCAGFINTEALHALQHARTSLGQPLVLTSAFRCPAHNEAQNGARMSYHQIGVAFDIRWPRLTKTGAPFSPDYRPVFIAILREAGFRGIGIYENWVHADMGPSRSWGLQLSTYSPANYQHRG